MISGVVADAWDRRRLMLGTQLAATVVAIALGVLAFRGATAVWPLYVLAALGSAVGAFDLPARNSLMPTLVPREHLPNAISLNTIMFQTASVLGPSLGGLLIAATHVGWAYIANAISFAFVVVALLMMRDVPARPKGEEGSHDDVSWRAAIEGLRFVFRAPLIRSTMLLDFFATFFSSATALLPIFAQDILHVGARGYGWLYAAPAAGAVLTSVVMVRAVDSITNRGQVLIAAIVVYGLATVVFGISTTFWLTFTCLALTGAADTISMIFRNLIRQLETPDYLRGRMMGVNMVFFMGGPQLGELEAGLVGNWLGPVVSVVSGGMGCLLATAWVAGRTPELRHYRSSEDSGIKAPPPPRRPPVESPLKDVQPPAEPMP